VLECSNSNHFVDYITWTVNLLAPIVLSMDSRLNRLKLSLARSVKLRRKALGLSQEELADLAEIDRTYASQIERGVANPSLEVLFRLASSLNTDVSGLLIHFSPSAK
jgi:DNA-binding XRE family transcriptional regulator